jgi:hypothetical protein
VGLIAPGSVSGWPGACCFTGGMERRDTSAPCMGFRNQHIGRLTNCRQH